MTLPPEIPTPQVRAVCPHLQRSPQDPTAQIIVMGGKISGPVEFDLCRECADLVTGDLTLYVDDDDQAIELLQRLRLVWAK